VALRKRRHRRTTVFGVPMPKVQMPNGFGTNGMKALTNLDAKSVAKAAKQVGKASKRFGETTKGVSKDIERLGEQAERLGKTLD
jgi:hypothetical protein